jgi:hypothetical protein
MKSGAASPTERLSTEDLLDIIEDEEDEGANAEAPAVSVAMMAVVFIIIYLRKIFYANNMANCRGSDIHPPPSKYSI